MHSKGIGLMLLALGVAGCDADLMATAGRGQVQVGMKGSGSSAPAAAMSQESAESAPEGTVEFRARVYVESSAGEWVELTTGAESVIVGAWDGKSTAVATADLEAGTYGRVRLEFEEVRARLDGGVSIGLPHLTGEVVVDVGGDGKVVVERAVELRVRSGVESQLTVNLHADRWLSGGDASAGAVTEATFEGAVTVAASEG